MEMTENRWNQLLLFMAVAVFAAIELVGLVNMRAV